jgi:hypothetical protein
MQRLQLQRFAQNIGGEFTHHSGWQSFIKEKPDMAPCPDRAYSNAQGTSICLKVFNNAIASSFEPPPSKTAARK